MSEEVSLVFRMGDDSYSFGPALPMAAPVFSPEGAFQAFLQNWLFSFVLLQRLLKGIGPESYAVPEI